MPRVTGEFQHFRNTKIIPFLKNHVASDFFKDTKLVKEYAQLKGVSVDSVKKPGKMQRKISKYLSNLKILYNDKASDPLEALPLYEVEENKSDVSFNAQASKAAYEGIAEQIEFINNARKDLLYFFKGGNKTTESTFALNENDKLQPLERERILSPFIEEYQAIAKILKQSGLKNGKMLSDEQRSSLSKQLKLIEDYALSPLKILESITNAGLNLQKEMQGIILNDQALLANGHITKKIQTSNIGIPQILIDLYSQDEKEKVFQIEK